MTMDVGEAQALAGLRVAVVEDDAELRALLVAELGDHGVQATPLESAEALYRHLAANPCDIVLLDLVLPGEDGYSVTSHLRHASSVGIVMLTGRGTPRDMAGGLGRGADLYLVKPLDLDVLLAGLATVRRRLAPVPGPAAGGDKAVARDWSLQAGGWRLQAPDGTALDLGEGERAFLQPLFATPGRPVDRETLIAGMTDSPWDFDPHRLEVLVHRLRTRVRDTTGQALPVRAVRGAGYLLVPAAG